MPMKDNWSFKKYLPPNSDERWLFRKNLAPAISPKDPGYNFIAYLTFHYHPTGKSGLPTDEEAQVFAEFENTFLETFEKDGLSVFVAVVTKSGIKDFLFYTRDPHIFLKTAEQFRNIYPEFLITCELSPDPLWDQYKDFP